MLCLNSALYTVQSIQMFLCESAVGRCKPSSTCNLKKKKQSFSGIAVRRLIKLICTDSYYILFLQ